MGAYTLKVWHTRNLLPVGIVLLVINLSGGNRINIQFHENIQDILANASDILSDVDLPLSEDLIYLRQIVKTIEEYNEQNNFLDFGLNITSTSDISEKEIADYIQNVWKNRIFPCLNGNNLKTLPSYRFGLKRLLTNAIREVIDWILNKAKPHVYFKSCKLVVGTIKTFTPHVIRTMLKKLEIFGIYLHVGIIEPIVSVVAQAPDQTATSICGYLVGGQLENFELIKDSRPQSLPPYPNDDIKGSYYKVLHLSDIHLDLQYEQNQFSYCVSSVCCRKHTAPVWFTKSGFWGTRALQCDIPERLVENALKSIIDTHPDIDYILWTGDVVPHDFKQTPQSVAQMLQLISNIFKKYFPKLSIYSSLGNHDGSPTNIFTSSDNWLYSTVKQLWTPFINDSEVQFSSAGYYSTQTKHGIRLISLNMNFCYIFNWWIILSRQDPSNELSWLIKQLESAEKQGEKVHIIGHIPPGLIDCVATWSRLYFKIIKRFSKTVTAQFFGHTHLDEFQVFEENNIPFSIAYITPSMTTFRNVNPAYRIYHVDKQTKVVKNHETWITEINNYNLPDVPPKWHKLYDAKQEYGLLDLSPSSWRNLVTRMTQDDKLFQKFYKNQYRHTHARHCSSTCKSDKLCQLKSGKSHSEKEFCK